MKRKIFLALGSILLIIIGYATYIAFTTRSHSPATTASFDENGLAINVTYCQPFKKGRLIFGEEKDGALQPNGKYWRLGANEATMISFNKDVSFAGKPVTAGQYRMYAIPNAGSWKVVLNSELGKWGYFEADHTLDVASVDVPVQTAPAETEQFTISFNRDTSDVKMNFVWDKTLVSLPISVQQ